MDKLKAIENLMKDRDKLVLNYLVVPGTKGKKVLFYVTGDRGIIFDQTYQVAVICDAKRHEKYGWINTSCIDMIVATLRELGHTVELVRL